MTVMTVCDLKKYLHRLRCVQEINFSCSVIMLSFKQRFSHTVSSAVSAALVQLRPVFSSALNHNTVTQENLYSIGYSSYFSTRSQIHTIYTSVTSWREWQTIHWCRGCNIGTL